MNAPRDVIEEFERNRGRHDATTVGQTSGLANHPMHITDVGTLMKLESLVEDGSESIIREDEYQELLKQKRDREKRPDNDLICNRCHQLKNQNKLLEYKRKEESSPPEPGKIIRLSDHVTSFNRAEIVKAIFK